MKTTAELQIEAREVIERCIVVCKIHGNAIRAQQWTESLETLDGEPRADLVHKIQMARRRIACPTASSV